MNAGVNQSQQRSRPLRVVSIGASEFTVSCATGVLDSGADLVGMIGIPESLRPDNSVDMGAFAREREVGYRELEDLNTEPSLAALRSYEADYVLSSWPFILRTPALSVPRRFVIGSHPTALPRNRGRHPAHWTIVLGLQTSALTFFRMDEGIDSGPVLQQTPFVVPDGITVAELNTLISELARPAVAQLCRRLAAEPDFEGVQQDASLANYWRKRTPHDVTIDFRMSAESIVRTIRSFAPPFPGAILLIDAHVMRVAHASVIERAGAAQGTLDLETGRVVEAASRRLVVKAADALVELVTVEELPADLAGIRHIHPPARYVQKHRDATRS